MRIAILSRKSRLYTNREIRRAAKARGHSITTFEPVNLHFSVNDGGVSIFDRSKRQKQFDAMIPRIQSEDPYGLAAIRQFEISGSYVINQADAICLGHDKFATFQALKKAKLPVPPTVLLKHPLSVKSAIREIGGYPAVFKPLAGAQGMGVTLIEDESKADSLVGLGWEWDQPSLLQKFYPESSGEDFRLLLIGGEVIASMKRVAKKGEWRSNFHRGGKGFVYTPSQKEEKLAIRAAKAVGLNLCGVDIIKTDDGVKLLELNASPGLEEISRATGIDVADKLIEFIEEKVSK